jgi:dUTP pyrophosphatase
MTIKVKIKKVHPGAIIPEYAHEGDSGMDLQSVENIKLNSLQRTVIKTGLSFEIPKGYEIQIRSKSGISLNKGIVVINSPGTIDSCYRGEILIALFNTSNETRYIKEGDKIAQLVLQKVEKIEFEESNELNITTRGYGGFGSTEKKLIF